MSTTPTQNAKASSPAPARFHGTDMRVNFAGLSFKNPIIAASGTFG